MIELRCVWIEMSLRTAVVTAERFGFPSGLLVLFGVCILRSGPSRWVVRLLVLLWVVRIVVLTISHGGKERRACLA